MERPTDEALWAQYAAIALTRYLDIDPAWLGDSAAAYAASAADVMLAEHRKRFPVEAASDEVLP